MASPIARSRPASATDHHADADDNAAFLAAQDPIDAQAASWLVRQQDGWSADEEAACRAWLQADPAHHQAFARLTEVAGALDGLPASRIAQLRAQVRPPVLIAPRPAVDRPGTRRRLPYALAAAGLLAILGGGLLRWSYLQAQPVFTQTYTTARGESLSMTLPDGSVLQLDTATTATVALYRDRRTVRLVDGQALFTVTADRARPFEVDAGPLRASVVGTRFAVRNTTLGLGAGGVTVTVDQGRVDVSSQASSQGGKPQPVLALTAGQGVRSDAAGRLGPPQTLSAGSALLWREGRVNLDNVALSQALAEFERYGDTRLTLDPAVSGMRISGSFALRQAGAFAQALPRVLPVRLRMRDGNTEVILAD